MAFCAVTPPSLADGEVILGPVETVVVDAVRAQVVEVRAGEARPPRLGVQGVGPAAAPLPDPERAEGELADLVVLPAGAFDGDRVRAPAWRSWVARWCGANPAAAAALAVEHGAAIAWCQAAPSSER